MSETPPEQPTQPTEPAQAPSWEELFKDQDPAKVREALDNSRKWETRAKENYEKAKRLDEIEESQKTEQQKVTERLEQAETASRTAAIENARLRVILSTLPDEQGQKLLDLAARLRGENDEELQADAQRLLAWANPAPATPSFDGGARTPARSVDMNQIIRGATGRS